MGTIRFTILLVVSAIGVSMAEAQTKTPGTDQGPDNSVCAACHDQAQKIAGTVHASLACATCHEKHGEYPHPANVPKPVCGNCHSNILANYNHGVHGMALASGNQGAPECATCHGSAHEIANPAALTFRKQVPETCGMCHVDIASQFQKSVHGKALAQGVAKAPVCNDCHGEHNILKPSNEASTVNPRNIRETCSQCHGNLALSRQFGLPADRITTFDQSFHGLALKAGQQTVANCASCHGVHDILPPTDAKSSINPKNLPATCGKCHPGAGARFALGQVHQAEGGKEPAAVTWVRQFYLLVIPTTIGLMMLHNIGDWIHKLGRSYRGVPPSRVPQMEGSLRMFRAERVLHATLAISFLVLAWSGFALKYPDAWWARPFMLFQSHIEVRRNVHRVAAVVFMLDALAHIVLVAINRKLRQHWLVLVPRLDDVREGMAGFAYNLGLLRKRPSISPYSYIEKAEYWALVWGSVIMMVTGLALWANSFVMKWLSKTVLDVSTAVHFYEAALATLAIVAWHWYFVILDPDIYPMDTAWLSGRTARKHEHDDELEVGRAEVPEVARKNGSTLPQNYN